MSWRVASTREYFHHLWLEIQNELESHVCSHNLHCFATPAHTCIRRMDETVRLWATSTGDIIDVLRHGLVHPITAVALSKGDALLAEASNDFTVRVWDTALGVYCRYVSVYLVRVWCGIFVYLYILHVPV